ncbi:MAG TPA: DUF5330 domain-containing protein [Pseudolabrys sp.]
MGRVMFFLLRMAFWLTVVCVLLPSGSNNTPADAQIDATQAASLAAAAVSDARGFCERQPDACEVGGKVAVAIGHKAEAGARTLFEFISTKMTEKSASTDKASPRLIAGQASHQAPISGTLTSSDMAPAWQGPVPLPPRREARAARPAA